MIYHSYFSCYGKLEHADLSQMAYSWSYVWLIGQKSKRQ